MNANSASEPLMSSAESNSGSNSNAKKSPIIRQFDPTKVEVANPSQLNMPEVRDKSARARRKRFRLALRAVAAEFIGTALFFTAVFGCIILGLLTGSAASTPALHIFTVGLGSGFALTSLIYIFSNISGCILNPAVTIALFVSGGLSRRKTLMFCLAQLAGSLLAMGFVSLIYPLNSGDYDSLAVGPGHGASDVQVFFMEGILTFILVFIAFSCAYNESEQLKQNRLHVKIDGLAVFTTSGSSSTAFAPIIIGFTVFFLTLLGAPITGAAFNPVRVLAPAIVSGVWDKVHLYLISQILFGIAAGLFVSRGQRWGIDDEEEQQTQSEAAEKQKLVESPLIGHTQEQEQTSDEYQSDSSAV